LAAHLDDEDLEEERRVRRVIEGDAGAHLAAHEVGEASGEAIVHDVGAGGIEAEGGAPHGERHRQGPRQVRPTSMLSWRPTEM